MDTFKTLFLKSDWCEDPNSSTLNTDHKRLSIVGPDLKPVGELCIYSSESHGIQPHTSFKTNDRTLTKQIEVLKLELKEIKEKNDKFEMRMNNQQGQLHEEPISLSEVPEMLPNDEPDIKEAHGNVQLLDDLHMKVKELESTNMRLNQTIKMVTESKEKEENLLKSENISLQTQNETLTIKTKKMAMKLNKVKQKFELKLESMKEDMKHHNENMEKTLKLCENQLSDKKMEVEERSKITDHLNILLNVDLTINDKIDKYISAYPGCQSSQVSSVQKLPDDVKKYCMELENRVGANINEFARDLGLDPGDVIEIRNETKDLREVFWKVVCSCCTEGKEQLSIDMVRKAAAAIGIDQEYLMTDMSKEHQEILIKHHSYLVENMMPTITLTYLKTTGLLSDAEVYYITDPLAESVMTENLLTLLRMKGDTAFEKLLKALKESGQGHLADKLLGDDDDQTIAKELEDDDVESDDDIQSNLLADEEMLKSSSNQYNQNRHPQGDDDTQDLTIAKESAEGDFESDDGIQCRVSQRNLLADSEMLEYEAVTVSRSSSNRYNQNRDPQGTPTLTSHIPTGAAVSEIATKDDIKKIEEQLEELKQILINCVQNQSFEHSEDGIMVHVSSGSRARELSMLLE